MNIRKTIGIRRDMACPLRPTIALTLALIPTFASADTLKNAGILGNSGESGSSLVTYARGDNSGMGVAYDKYGSLWDRGGTGQLNRYAVDGRLLGTYKLPPDQQNRNADQVVVLGDKLLIRLGKGLYSLPLDAPAGTAATALNMPAELLSPSVSKDGSVAIFNAGELFLLNAGGEKKSLGSGLANIRAIEIGPDNTVYVSDWNNLTTAQAGTPPTLTNLGPNPGERPNFIDGFWYANVWHSTIRRFDANLKAAPGVVLGGNSGSFIGHVDEQAELVNARGIAKLSPELFAVSGIGGVVTLLQWSEAETRFKPIRRIGAINKCPALAMDRDGRVWYDSGDWEWDDGPATPLRFGIPAGDVFAGTTLEDGSPVLYGRRNNQPTLYWGKLTQEIRMQQGPATLPANGVAAASTQVKKRRALLILQKNGAASAILIGGDGSLGGDLGPVELKTETPPKTWTGLAALGNDKLFAAADGFILEFARDGDGWKETARWNSWGDGPADKFGPAIKLAATAGKLWVSDTARHRVLALDPATHKPLAQFGHTDEAGNDLGHLSAPDTLTANGPRAVVFDSTNQRLVRLELVPQ